MTVPLMIRAVRTPCTAALAGALLMLLAGTAPDSFGGPAPGCQNFSGSWQTKDLAVSEMLILQSGCTLEGSFKVAGGAKKRFTHKFAATASGSTATGTVTRTDPAGCKTNIHFTLAAERGNLVYRATDTDGACQVPVDFTELREWQRIAPTRVALVFRCPNCGAELGRCTGNVVGSRCTYCASPAGGCRCPYCKGSFYEIAHVHNY